MDYFQQDFTVTTASSSSDDAFANAFDLALPTTSSARQLTDELNELRKARSALSLKQTEQKKIQDVLYGRHASVIAPSEEKYQKEQNEIYGDGNEDEDLRMAIEASMKSSVSINKEDEHQTEATIRLIRHLEVYDMLQSLHDAIANQVTERYRVDRSKLDTYFHQLSTYMNKLQSYDPVISLLYHSWDYMLSVVNDCGQKIVMDLYLITTNNVYKSSLHYERGWSSSPWRCHTTDLLQSRLYTFDDPIHGYPINVFNAMSVQNGHRTLGIDHHSNDRNESIIHYDRLQLEKQIGAIIHTLPGIDLPPLPRGWKEMYNEKREEYLYLNETTAECTLERPIIIAPSQTDNHRSD